MAAITLLAFSLLSKFLAPDIAISVPRHGTGILLPPGAPLSHDSGSFMFFRRCIFHLVLPIQSESGPVAFLGYCGRDYPLLGLVLSLRLFTEAGCSEGVESISARNGDLRGGLCFDGVTGLAHIIFVVNLVSGVARFRGMQH